MIIIWEVCVFEARRKRKNGSKFSCMSRIGLSGVLSS